MAAPKGGSTLSRILKVLAIVLAVVVGFTVFSPSTKDVTWKEEVRLAGNAIIFVERTQTYRRVSEPGAGSGWLFVNAKLAAQMPGRSTKINWEGSVQPLVLQQDGKGTTYLLCTVEGYRGRHTYGVPEGTRYVTFRLETMHGVACRSISFREDSSQIFLLRSTEHS